MNFFRQGAFTERTGGSVLTESEGPGVFYLGEVVDDLLRVRWTKEERYGISGVALFQYNTREGRDICNLKNETTV